MSSLFEVYDPYTFFMGLSLNWFISLFLFGLMFSSYWLSGCNYSALFSFFLNFIFFEFRVFLKFKILSCLSFFFVFLFFYFLLVNLLGLVPYVFSVSSHFVFCLSFSFPLWLGVMVMGWLNTTNLMFMHLIPMGTPFLLISFMVLIETISQLIRPWSLAVRLMANMISGHLLMSLLGGCGSGLLLIQLVLFFFEFFVCFIQSYVFCALLVLYYGEV